ncbi:hypothetical protein CLBKND_02343 [Methylorubrum aminovorans]
MWGLVPAKGARSYAVWLSYDGGVTRELLHNGPGIDGRAPMRQSDSVVTVIAVAYGATGLPGPEKSATFTTVAPIVRGELVDVVTLPPIDYTGLSKDVRTRIENALGTAQDALTKALKSLDNDATNAAALIAEQTTRVNQDGALATRIDGVVTLTNQNAAAVTSEITARTNADSALATRIDAVVVKADSALAGVTSEQTARINADGALGQRIDAVVTKADNALAGVVNEATARINADGALGERINAVQARSDAGTATGRMTLWASSGIAGVQARFETLLAIETGGQIRGAGYYIDLMPDGSSRFVIDANGFYITANGQTSPAFSYDGYTLTIPSLRVTDKALLPGAAMDNLSLVAPNEVDGGGFSNDWREVPGTGITVSPDAVWSIIFGGTAILGVVAQGNANLITTTRLAVAVGVDGVPYGAAFAVAVASAGGSAPTVVTTDTPIQSGPALFEILPAGRPRRVNLLYQLTGQIGSGRIKFGQLKIAVSKR